MKEKILDELAIFLKAIVETEVVWIALIIILYHFNLYYLLAGFITGRLIGKWAVYRSEFYGK